MNEARARRGKLLAGSPVRKRIAYGALGAVAGYAYYHFVGCSTGTCPISSNPWISTMYGVAVGLVLAFGEQKRA